MTIIDIIFFLLSLLGIVYVAFFRFKRYRTDKFRQNVFALREELFDFAAKGNISFNHPAYITLRSMMNGYIRFSHRLSLLQVMILSFFDKEYHPKTFDETWKEVTFDLDKTVKDELDRLVFKASKALFYYVFLSSFIKKVVAIPCVIWLIIREQVKNQKRVESDAGIKENKSKNLELITFRYTKKHSGLVEDSIDYLNTDALVFGRQRNKASVVSV